MNHPAVAVCTGKKKKKWCVDFTVLSMENSFFNLVFSFACIV